MIERATRRNDNMKNDGIWRQTNIKTCNHIKIRFFRDWRIYIAQFASHSYSRQLTRDTESGREKGNKIQPPNLIHRSFAKRWSTSNLSIEPQIPLISFVSIIRLQQQSKVSTKYTDTVQFEMQDYQHHTDFKIILNP